jgi:hypothetical protein
MEWIEDILLKDASETDQVNKQWLESAQQVAPYSILPALLYLKHNGVKGNEDVLAKLSISHPDRQALAMLLGEDASMVAHFYPHENMAEALDTITTIDRFLDNYGKTSPGEIEALDRAIFNPQPDYADVLAAHVEHYKEVVVRARGHCQHLTLDGLVASLALVGLAPYSQPFLDVLQSRLVVSLALANQYLNILLFHNASDILK